MYMNIYEGWNTPAWKERNNTYTHSTVQGWEENSAFSLEISKAMESSQEYSNAGDILYAQAKDPQTDVATEQTLLIYMLLSEKCWVYVIGNVKTIQFVKRKWWKIIFK